MSQHKIYSAGLRESKAKRSYVLVKSESKILGKRKYHEDDLYTIPINPKRLRDTKIIEKCKNRTDQLDQIFLEDDIETLKVLVQKGIILDSSMFYKICRIGSLECFKFLYQCGLRPTANDLANAMAYDHEDKIIMFLSEIGVKFGYSDLNSAIGQQKWNLVNFFLNIGVDCNEHTIMNAEREGNFALIKRLLDVKAPVPKLNQILRIENCKIRGYLLYYRKYGKGPPEELRSRFFRGISEICKYFL